MQTAAGFKNANAIFISVPLKGKTDIIGFPQLISLFRTHLKGKIFPKRSNIPLLEKPEIIHVKGQFGIFFNSR